MAIPQVDSNGNTLQTTVIIAGRRFPAKSEKDAENIISQLLSNATADNYNDEGRKVPAEAGRNIGAFELKALFDFLNAYSSTPRTRKFAISVKNALMEAAQKSGEYMKDKPQYYIKYEDVMSNPFLNSLVKEGKRE